MVRRKLTSHFFFSAAAFAMGLVLAYGNRAVSEEILLELAAGSHDRENLTVSVALPESLRDAKNLTLKRLPKGQPIPVQCTSGENPRAVWIVRDPLPAGQVRRYSLAPSETAPSEKAGVKVEDDGKRLLVKVGDKPILAYNHAIVSSPNPKLRCYARSGYIHPVYSPSGEILTDDFNPDHAHQHGIMFAWRKGHFEGRDTNAWHQAAGKGRIEHVAVEAFGGGPVFGHFTVALRQLDLTAPGDPKPVLDETWHVRIDRFEPFFVFDMEIIQRCAGKSPYRVDKIHYGGMAIRGTDRWFQKKPGDFDFLTDLGKSRKNGDQTPARWVDFFGPIGDGLAGIDVMCHPGNFRFPQPVRLHPWMPYFCFTPASRGSFTLEPGKTYVSRYRFHVHDGKLNAQKAERLWNDYAHPPAVRVVNN